MAEKKGTTIVIKKIIVAGAGHHGGSWKVALADFMTAMMAFFLVMWLLGQSEETKKAVSDYFSTPSILEYNYQNFGATVTLEKLFLDLANDPIDAIKQFLEPMPKSPDLLDMGSAKIVQAYLADQLTDLAKEVQVTSDGFEFDIPDRLLFERGQSKPTAKFSETMDKITTITTGLKDADVKISSVLYIQTVPEATEAAAQKVAFQRLEILKKRVSSSLEHPTVTIKGAISTKDKRGEMDPEKLVGSVRISIKQKEVSSESKSRRKLEVLFDDTPKEMSQVVETRTPQSEGQRGVLPADALNPIAPVENPLDQELRDNTIGPSKSE